MQGPTHNLDKNSKTNKRRGLIASLVFHALLAVVFLIFGMSYPYPPPPEEGVMINFGTAEKGSGEVQPETKQQPVKEQISEEIENENIEEAPEETVEPENVPEPQQKEVATQETEEAPSIDQKEEKEEKEKPQKEPEEKKPEEQKKKEEKKQPDNTDQQKEQKKEPEPEAEEKEKPEVDEEALFPGAESNKNKKSKGEGNDALFEGDKGQKNGEKDKGAYKGDESKGKGDSGIGHSLEGRSLQKAPDVKDKSQETGKVVLNIKVDPDGNVKHVEYSLKGSTTQDKYLIQKAKEAAREAKFNTAPNAPEEQWGKMTFTFRVE